jgi:hypothetical protein
MVVPPLDDMDFPWNPAFAGATGASLRLAGQ